MSPQLVSLMEEMQLGLITSNANICYSRNQLEHLSADAPIIYGNSNRPHKVPIKSNFILKIFYYPQSPQPNADDDVDVGAQLL